MKIIDLYEGATDILYHYTNLHAAADVFAAGAFRLSTALGTQAELDLQPPGYPYYFSTTRSKSGSYHRHVGKNAVMFVLDGQWFQQRYPVKPVDYWAGMNANRKEAEDRVYSRDSEIPLGGVRAVHILFRESGGTESSLLRKILISSKTQGIQTYVYDDESAWRLQDQRRALDTEALLSVAQGEMDPEYRAWTSQRQALQTQEEPRGVSAWNELIQTPAAQYDKLSKNAQKIAYDFRYDKEYYWRGRVESLKTDIHNSKSQRSGFEYPAVVKLTKLMRQAGLKSIGDLVQYLRDKWRLKESLTPMNTEEFLTEAPKKKKPSEDQYAKVPLVQIDHAALAQQTVDHIKTHAQPWMALTGNGQNFKVFRGVLKPPAREMLSFVVPVRQDRVPKDTKLKKHQRFNALIAAAGGTANRSNSAFVTSDITTANFYGRAYVYIPLGDFTYTFSPYYHDWTENFSNEQLDGLMVIPKSGQKQSLDVTDPASYDRKRVKARIRVNTEIERAIKNGLEIMIKSDQGLYVEPFFYNNSVLPLLAKTTKGKKK